MPVKYLKLGVVRKGPDVLLRIYVANYLQLITIHTN